jgi:hypothetical protein
MAEFDYGTEHDIKEPGSDFKNPAVGEHAARLRSLIHVGLFRDTYNGVRKKTPFPYVVAIFELKEEDDFEDDGETPLTISKAFPLKKGDKAFMTKFISALDPKGNATGFDDMIGSACSINCKAGKEKKEDGSPKYVNFGGISGLSAKFASLVDPLVNEGVGHCRFTDITEAAIFEMAPIREVNMILMEAEDYEGSKAESIIKAIRKDDPEFAVRKEKPKDDESSDSTDKKDESTPDVASKLKEDEEF